MKDINTQEQENIEECGTEESLNLQYLVAPRQAAPFPWGGVAIFLGFLTLIGILLGLAYQARPKIQVKWHRVSQGETLNSLALHYYKDPRHWQIIYQANRKKLQSHKKLMPGQKIRIPFTKSQFNKWKKQKKSR